ncbi:DNA repair protein RecN [Schumannella luteola]|uniref:DNA repair protein RecN n=1 Tax=Schumannella luteola TaxID=472059 RepID=A0A852YHJ0_9MICO|nr:DNA repair protein RecN (Recombination protein N) [Schumannella luteola]TPX02286.1 DNA repair protein RecN [Schumannella luteola]
MIEEISIRDLGVIREAVLPLGPGFTALTGETGAGKTMVVTALGLLLGARSDAGSVRSGAGAAVVEGRWSVADPSPVAERVRDAGGDLDEVIDGRGELLLSRSVSSEGRSRATVGGRSAPVGVLGELGERLVVVHGQSDQLRLTSATAQREALDRHAGPELAAKLDDYRAGFDRWQRARAELEVLTTERDRRIREAVDLRAALDEIETLAPQRGEDQELAETAERLTNHEELRLAASEAQQAISSQEIDGGTDAVALVEAARRALERGGAHDPELAAIGESAAELSFGLSDLSGRLSTYLASLEGDSARELEAIQERRAALGGLARRFGPTVDDVVDFAETGGTRLLELDGDEDRIAELGREVEEGLAEVEALADEISALRRTAAEQLAAAVTAELAALAMPDARLHIEVTERELGTSGRDAVAILLQPHPGTEPRSIAKGASGGELSRVMLAIEVVLAGSDPVPTFVFDEVDAGVGGASAIEIGRRLQRLATSAQVIVVTHLAQVAAFATNHLAVVKSTDGAITASDVRALEGEERLSEMARLLSGLADSDSGLAHARELLEVAETAAREA